ncbi:MAG: helix-turn-helix transcriptional regulator [Actinomycetota bacterium]
MPPVAAAPRLARILVMVPWVVQHPEEATVAAVCARFGITERELTADLNLLLVCGLPPFSPGDMIEAGIEGDRVVISMADYLSRPLRLTRWEAVSLLAAGRAIAALPGLKEAEALSGALDKLAAVAVAPGEADAAAVLAQRVAIELEPPDGEVLATLRSAIEERRTIRMEYYSFGRDELTTRDADPLLVFGSRPWYLVANDHKTGEQRTFRVDRIRSLGTTDRTFERPAAFDPVAEAERPLYRPGAQDIGVVLDLGPDAAWVAEVTPHDSLEPGASGRLRLTLRTGSTAWLERLVLQLGPAVEVVEPASLAEAARSLARSALLRYG